jgi:homoserine kinase
LIPEKNLITKTAIYVLSTHGIATLPPLKIHVNNPIPLGRGLGSSGSAVVAGVLLANAAGNLNMSKDRMLDYCLMVERHPDNVAPALFGGFVASFLRELEPEELEPISIPRSEPTRNGAEQPPVPVTDIGHYIELGWTAEIKAIAVIPDFEVATEDARAVLPDMYERADVVGHWEKEGREGEREKKRMQGSETINGKIKLVQLYCPFRSLAKCGLPFVHNLN